MVARVGTSCPCLNVADQSINIGPGEAADLTVKFDSVHDPDFRGGLSIDVIGRGPAGGIVIGTRVDLDVRAQPAKPVDRELAVLVSDLERGAR